MHRKAIQFCVQSETHRYRLLRNYNARTDTLECLGHLCTGGMTDLVMDGMIAYR